MSTSPAMARSPLPGARQLRRLEVFVDVVFALIFFQILDYLPAAEDLAWAEKPLGLLQVLLDHPDDLLRIVVGLGITLIYWMQSVRFLRSLDRSDDLHTALTLLQIVFLCFFVYFAISDPGLVGGASSPALQSVTLALAGFTAAVAWRIALKRGLVVVELTEDDRRRVFLAGLTEPIAAVLTFGLAFVSPRAWTIGWVVLPILWGLGHRGASKPARAAEGGE